MPVIRPPAGDACAVSAGDAPVRTGLIPVPGTGVDVTLGSDDGIERRMMRPRVVVAKLPRAMPIAA